ncbi:MAG: hypothetical protein KAU17_05945, partial [Spirochaetales bacterium]|nr:hypothetical protein [Spirochaetales bacterium]
MKQSKDKESIGKSGQLITLGIYLIIGLFIVFRLVAIFIVPIVGDEPDDFNIILTDVKGFKDFFVTPDAYELEQSRFPFIVSTPLVVALKHRAIIPLRILFLIVHLIYLLFSYKLIVMVTGKKSAGLMYVLAIVTSCFIASFSIFAITTSDNIYLLFHILSIYSFIKSYRSYKDSKIFTNYLVLALLIASCIASKLFGVLLLVALLLFHYIARDRRNLIGIQSVHPNTLICLGGAFFSGVVLINVLPMHPNLKLILALMLSIGYLLTLILWTVREKHGRYPLVKVGFMKFWLSLIVTAFNCTLILSPVYLNFSNFIQTFTWFDTWGSGMLVSRSHIYDMLLITVMKYGIPSIGVLFVVTALCVWAYIKHTKRHFFGSTAFLFILIFAIHFLIISAVKHKVTWYPLAIFPFLYLPLIWLWSFADKQHLRGLAVTSILCIALIVGDNCARYFYWFPYGHFDGAQFGREYIGWNRAGFISFEVNPQLIDYLNSQKVPGRAIVNCQVVDVPFYNNWFRILIQRDYTREGGKRYAFTSGIWDSKTEFDFLLTSPIYYPEFEESLGQFDAVKVKTLAIKGIDILSVWRNTKGVNGRR